MEFLKDTQKLLRAYFSLLKISYILSAFMALSLLFFGGEFHWFMLGEMIAALFFLGAQFYGSRKAHYLINKASYIGLLLAFVLNSLLLSSLFFPLGLAGLYVLLRKDTRNLFPPEKNPDWLNRFYAWMDQLLSDIRKTA